MTDVRGRPALGDAGTIAPIVRFRLPPFMLSRLDEVATAKGLTRSAVVRLALEHYLSHPEGADCEGPLASQATT